MTFWNILVVICFAILYLGITLVFLQVRRLGDTMRYLEEKSKRQVDEEAGGNAQEYLEALIRGLRVVEHKVDESLTMVPDQVLPQLEEIKQTLSELELSGSGSNQSAPVFSQQMSMPHSMERSSNSNDGGGGNGKGDAYREARLLLANGVDEERVISETGMTVEEVSLLKRITVQGSSE